MAHEEMHPITTPKGASLLTVILAVIGVFAPFFTTLESAQLFTAVALLVIVWLYWSEVRNAFRNRAGFTGLVLPSLAILIILGVALFATLKVQGQPTPAPGPGPALTAKDVSTLIADALKQEHPSSPPPLDRATTGRPETYRIVIQDPPPRRAPPVRAAPRTDPSSTILEETIRDVARNGVGLKAKSACWSEQIEVSAGLYHLIVDAANAQNGYAYDKNDKKMVDGLQAWIAKVERFFLSNKTSLPDISIVHLANEEKPQSTFLGIHDSGWRAWASMNAKRKVLEAIQADVNKRSCDSIGKAAIAECVENHSC